MVGRFLPWKGYREALEALHKLDKNIAARIQVHLCGFGELDAKIRQESRKLGKVKVHVYYSDNPISIFARAKLVLSLQHMDNYPSQSLLEAMSCGAVPIASDVGETKRLVDETVGYLVSHDAVDIGNAIEAGLANEDERNIKAVQARRRVQELHSVERFARYFDELLRADAP